MGSYKRKKLSSSYIGNGYENDPAKLLAAQIVIHAIDDWRELVKSKAWLDKHPTKNRNFNELRLFFKGEWCDFLLQDFEIDPARILEMLEAELEAAQEKEKRRWKKKSG